MYQIIAVKAQQLKELGLTDNSIARQLNAGHKSVSKAIDWINEFGL